MAKRSAFTFITRVPKGEGRAGQTTSMWSDLNDRLDRLGAVEQQRLTLDEKRMALELARFRLVKMQDGRLRELLVMALPYIKRMVTPPTSTVVTCWSPPPTSTRGRSKQKGHRQ